MKRTTYYIIGIPIGLLLLIVAFVTYISTLGMRWEDTYYVLDDEVEEISLPVCSQVYFVPQLSSSERLEDDSIQNQHLIKYNYSLLEVPLNTFSTDSVTPRLILPGDMAKHLKTELRGDTLFLAFEFSTEHLPKHLHALKLLKVKADGMQLFIPSSVERLESRIRGMEVTLDSIQRETFVVYAQGNVNVKHCKFADFYPASFSYVSLRSGSVENLHQDRDVFEGTLNICIDSFSVGTEYFSSSSREVRHLKEGECRRFVWEPKSDNAELVLTQTISEASEIEVR